MSDIVCFLAGLACGVVLTVLAGVTSRPKTEPPESTEPANGTPPPPTIPLKPRRRTMWD